MTVVLDGEIGVLDAFSFAHTLPGDNRDATGFGLLGSWCTVPSGAQHIGSRRAFVTLMPGIEVLDLYSASVWREIWKDGSAVECYVPKSVIGWEFYSMLYPQPDSASVLRLNGVVELLIGRPPGKELCPSIVFAFVPAGYAHISPSGPTGSTSAFDKRAASSRRKVSFESTAPDSAMKGSSFSCTVQFVERQQRNLGLGGRSLYARLVVLCPTAVFRDTLSMPPEVVWGLYISPRNRTMILVNRDRGRIDLQLACLLTHDAVFRRNGELISVFCKLFERFGTADLVPACFEDVDPLNIHCGFTNALVADHLDIEADGREDYLTYFGVRPSEFFLSNSSTNLCFLVPIDAQRHRAGMPIDDITLLREQALPDMPIWTLAGVFDQDSMRALRHYRERSRPSPEMDIGTVQGGLLHILGLENVGSGWLKALTGCREVTVAPRAIPEAPLKHLPGEPGPQDFPNPWGGAASGLVDGGSGGACGSSMPLQAQASHIHLGEPQSEASFRRLPTDALTTVSRMTVCHTRSSLPSERTSEHHRGGYL